MLSQVLRGEKTIGTSSIVRQAIVSGVRTPMQHYWFNLLHGRIFKGHPHNLRTVIAKTVVDQLAFGPVFMAAFFILNGILQRLSLDEIVAKFRSDFKRAMLWNWRVWPAVTLANFFFVPEHLRILVNNIVGLAWGVLLITLTSKAAPKQIEDNKKDKSDKKE